MKKASLPIEFVAIAVLVLLVIGIAAFMLIKSGKGISITQAQAGECTGTCKPTCAQDDDSMPFLKCAQANHVCCVKKTT